MACIDSFEHLNSFWGQGYTAKMKLELNNEFEFIALSEMGQEIKGLDLFWVRFLPKFNSILFGEFGPAIQLPM